VTTRSPEEVEEQRQRSAAQRERARATDTPAEFDTIDIPDPPPSSLGDPAAGGTSRTIEQIRAQRTPTPEQLAEQTATRIAELPGKPWGRMSSVEQQAAVDAYIENNEGANANDAIAFLEAEDTSTDLFIPDLEGVQHDFKTEERETWEQIRYYLKDKHDLPRLEMINERVLWAAERFRMEHGTYPSFHEFQAYPPLDATILLYKSGIPNVGPTFMIGDDFFVNDRWMGPQPMGPIVGSQAAQIGVEPTDLANLGPVDRSGEQFISSAGGVIEGELDEEGRQTFEATGTIERPLSQRKRLALAGIDAWTAFLQNTPRFESEEELLEAAAGTSPGGGGGGGGGGGAAQGRIAMPFDVEQLKNSATEQWRALLRTEIPESELSKIVADYMDAANAFWIGEAGQLDFQTYILGRIKDTARYNMLYGDKPEFFTDAEWALRYDQAVAQFGINATAGERQVIAGMTSGAGVAGFTERVGRTAEARLAPGRSGNFSQRVASLRSQMGL
jgi:hypothetical protein